MPFCSSKIFWVRLPSASITVSEAWSMPLKSVVVANFPLREKAGNRLDDAKLNSCAFLLKNGWFYARNAKFTFW